MRLNTTRGLAVFCIAARHMSFKSAAEQLYITPSAVSHQIKALEEQLGTSLFERRTRAVALTPTGSQLFTRVDPLLRELERATANFTGTARRRVLRLTLLPFFASEMFIPCMDRFPHSHMSIDLRLDDNDARESVHLTSADAAIPLLSSPPTDVCAHPLFPLRLVPACAPSLAQRCMPMGRNALLHETLIVHKSRPNAWNDWLTAEGFEHADDTRTIYLDSMYAVARAAERGLGIALVPVPLSNAWFRSKALVQLFEPELETGDCYYFVCRRSDEHDRDISALRNWVIATFGVDAINSCVA